ncbi:ornithine cyclodeaminase family protein [Aquipseudomonas alcaligenes]|uniref:Ornithine cyclodeaminase family protein n=1 Tax=Aquipseudomonas alcaligenes TaxID=43263 RepID=A0A2V4LQX9_AQUAC|nr:ornithine cyclodeaminase family protein [Pseudomonas alcaligenes]PYC20246.1 ornithine cyclodeaminase family protein [Pseudomonas alcaligenes]
MRVISRDLISAHFNSEQALGYIAEGFVAYSQGRVQMPTPQNFLFAEAEGDCCVKSAWLEGSSSFAVKVSTGFYANPKRGLESNDGLILVFCANTGQPLALLADHGWLTCMRTALAGRLVTQYLAPPVVRAIGIIGTGVQARLQLEQTLAVTDCRDVHVWGRSAQEQERFKTFAENLGCQVVMADSPETLVRNCNLIICATPSREPLVQHQWTQAGTHITAVGADAPGKQELDPKLMAMADLIVVDSVTQCSAYGEASHALHQHLIKHSDLIELGLVLQGKHPGRIRQQDLTIADLTGLAIQDSQIARCILNSIASADSA